MSTAMIRLIWMTGFCVIPAWHLVAEELPARAPGLWELVKDVADDPRPLPVIRQCTDETTDKALGGKAFFADYDSCSSFEVTRDGETWRIVSVCDSVVGEMHTVTLLSGNFKTQYRMDQSASIEGEVVQQTVVARRIGACEPTQKAGVIYINGRAFDLGEAVSD